MNIPKEEFDQKVQELCDLNVCLSKGEARRVILSGKFDKYKSRGLELQKQQASSSSTDKSNVTIWPCPRCSGKLAHRTNSKTQERFLGCTNYPTCKYTQKTEKPETLGIKDAAEVWE